MLLCMLRYIATAAASIVRAYGAGTCSDASDSALSIKAAAFTGALLQM
jgi:hypothetical protein